MLSFSADTAAKVHENEQVCGREQPHAPLDLKIHLKLISFKLGLAGLQKWETWIRIGLNSLSPYLLLVVSSPIFSSLLFSSSHALSACREFSPPFPPRLSLFVSVPLSPADALASQMSQQKGFVFFFVFLFSPLLLPSSLTSIHSAPAALSLLSAPLELLANTEGKEEWRGGESREGWMWDMGRWSADAGFPKGT